jgi:pimeloyl-ACP methyl ester carboxylesterase
MMNFTCFDLFVGTGAARLQLMLRRLPEPSQPGPAVLLLHGGNTSGDCFLFPAGGLATYLHQKGHDVWILEWRSSPLVLNPLLGDGEPLGGSVANERRLFNFDNVVSQDFPAALDQIRATIGPDTTLSVLGHCLGAGTLSMAIARGTLEKYRISNLVLSTLGLFVEVPWNGFMKADDFILERVVTSAPTCRGINPNDPLDKWPEDMRRAYELWPTAWLPAGTSPAAELLKRITFMFGQPYSLERLHPEMKGPAAAKIFGPMHVGLYMHIGQMVRRGYAARFDEPDVIDRAAPPLQADAVVGDLDPTHFLNKRVTLIGAAENRLWHRDSIDLMYEWLRASAPQTQRERYTKHILPGYMLQELLWGIRAAQDVFPLIEAGLRPATAAASPVPMPAPPNPRLRSSGDLAAAE